MTKRKWMLIGLCGALCLGGSRAEDPAIEVETAGIGGSTVILEVHNTESSAETVRVQLSVLLTGGGEQTLTSANVTVEGGSTVTVSLNAAGSIVAIGDDPQPILPLP